MKRFCLHLPNILVVLVLVGIIAPQTSTLFCQDEPVQAQTLKSFRITPKRDGAFDWIGAVYNPNLNRYIILYYEFKNVGPDAPYQTLYSQMFNRKGKKVGSLNKLATLKGSDEFSPEMNMALNEIENQILLVWAQFIFDEIYGIVLSGDGRLDPSIEMKQIKASTGPASGLYPKVVWIPGRNQYAVAWSHYDDSNATNPDSGFYLSILNQNLKTKLKPFKVKQQSMKNFYSVTTLLPRNDRILWGAAQDSAKKMRPVVWFTDYKGEVIDVPKAKRNGSIFPGPKTKGGAQVYAEYNPYDDQYLLLWQASDNRNYRYRTYSDIYYRIMNSDGSFVFKKRKIPKKFRFLEDAKTLFNPILKHFLVIYAEYNNLYRENPFVEYQGGRIWATYIDSRGQLGHPDNPGGKAIPLTDHFTDKETGMYFFDTVYNPIQNEYLVVYMLADYQDKNNVSSDIWGIILKSDENKW